MTSSPNAKLMRHCLVVLLLVAGQSLAFAHGVDEASHPAASVCDLCIASQPLGAAAGGSTAPGIAIPEAECGLLPEFPPPAPVRAYLTPGQRAPPVSL